MFRVTRIGLVFALSISFTLPIAAQDVRPTVSAEKTRDSVERIPADHKRALSILDRILKTSADFEDTALRLKIQAEAADLLWRYDEPRARNLFELSLQSIDNLQPSSNDMIATQSFAGFKIRLRSDILKSLSAHDGDFAERLARSAVNEGTATVKAAPRCVGCGFQIESVTQTLRLALNAVQADPQRAVELAKEALSGGINSSINGVLITLRRRDPALADELFSYVLTVARDKTTYISDGAYYLALYVFPNFGAGAIGGSQRPAGAEIKPELIQQYLAFFADAAEKEALMLQAKGRDAGDSQFGRRVSLDYFVGEQMLPYFDRHMPDRTAAVRTRIDQIIAVLPASESRAYLDDIGRARTASFFAEKAQREKDTERQQDLYLQAAFQANARREYDEALAMLPKISDASIRSYVESAVRYDKARTALSNGDLDAAYRQSNEISDPCRRSDLLGQIALTLLSRKDLPGAAQALAQAQKTVEQADAGFTKARGLLDLVNLAAQIDPAGGFEAMKSAIETLNGTELPRQWDTKKLVVSKSTGKMFTWEGIGLEYLRFDKSFERLAIIDFDRSLKLAETLQSTEALALAELALCRIALSRQ